MQRGEAKLLAEQERAMNTKIKEVSECLQQYRKDTALKDIMRSSMSPERGA